LANLNCNASPAQYCKLALKQCHHASLFFQEAFHHSDSAFPLLQQTCSNLALQANTALSTTILSSACQIGQ